MKNKHKDFTFTCLQFTIHSELNELRSIFNNLKELRLFLPLIDRMKLHQILS